MVGADSFEHTERLASTGMAMLRVAYVLRGPRRQIQAPQNAEQTSQSDSIAIGKRDLVEKEPPMIPSCRLLFPVGVGRLFPHAPAVGSS